MAFPLAASPVLLWISWTYQPQIAWMKAPAFTGGKNLYVLCQQTTPLQMSCICCSRNQDFAFLHRFLNPKDHFCPGELHFPLYPTLCFPTTRFTVRWWALTTAFHILYCSPSAAAVQYPISPLWLCCWIGNFSPGAYFFPWVSSLQHLSEQPFTMEFFTPKLTVFHLSTLSCAALIHPRYSKLILLMYQIKLFLIICLTLSSAPFVKLSPTFPYY